MTVINSLVSRIVRIAPPGSFLSNTLTLVTGTALAQAIPILVSPLLTRLYTPGQMGLLAVFSSLSFVLAVAVTARYELAVMLPESETDAVNIVALCFFISSVFSVMVLGVMVIFRYQITGLLKVKDISLLLYAIPGTVLLTGLFRSLTYWSNRKRKFKRLARCMVAQSVVASSLKIGFGYMGFGAAGLIAGDVAGISVAATMMVLQVLREDKAAWDSIDWGIIKKVARQYRDFPRKSLPGAVLNISSSHMPVLLMGVLYNTGILGLYALTMKVLNSPMTIVGNSVSQVFYEKAVSSQREGTLERLVKRITGALSLIIMLPMVLLLLMGPYLFAFVFGEEWREAGEIARVMVPFYMVRFVFSSQSTMMMVVRRMDFEIRFNFLFLAGQLLSLLLGYYFLKDHMWSFGLMSLSGTAVFIMLGVFIFKSSRTGRRSNVI